MRKRIMGAALLAVCAAQPAESTPTLADGGVDELKRAFNKFRHHTRVVALLSPT